MCLLTIFAEHGKMAHNPWWLSQWKLSNCIIQCYYTALSHKDWELPNSRIWLAEMDVDRGLDFPILTGT